MPLEPTNTTTSHYVLGDTLFSSEANSARSAHNDPDRLAAIEARLLALEAQASRNRASTLEEPADMRQTVAALDFASSKSKGDTSMLTDLQSDVFTTSASDSPKSSDELSQRVAALEEKLSQMSADQHMLEQIACAAAVDLRDLVVLSAPSDEPVNVGDILGTIGRSNVFKIYSEGDGRRFIRECLRGKK